MTTIVFDRRSKTLAADSQNTDAGGVTYRMNKLEHIGQGWMFAGSGHLYTIAQCRIWATHVFDEEHRPDFSFFLEDPEDRAFSCILINPTGDRYWIIDEEMMPFEPLDDFVSLGAGQAYALGALHAGATAKQAVEIACKCDTNSFEPVDIHQWPVYKPEETNEDKPTISKRSTRSR